MKVGAAIVSSDFRQVFAVGYNGNASGLPNGCDSAEPGKCGCIHAETNAVVSCTAARAEPKILFCTHLPCMACAKLIIQLGGVQEVYYQQDYRLKDSLVALTESRIKMGHLSDGGMDPAQALKEATKALRKHREAQISPT
jgi:dCMP deaminase